MDKALAQSRAGRTCSTGPATALPKEPRAAQTAIGRFPADGFTVLDREAVVAFGVSGGKDACIAELSARWLHVLGMPDPPAWWKTRPDRLGDECDALAVSREGEILAIEVKPHTAPEHFRRLTPVLATAERPMGVLQGQLVAISQHCIGTF